MEKNHVERAFFVKKGRFFVPASKFETGTKNRPLTIHKAFLIEKDIWTDGSSKVFIDLLDSLADCKNLLYTIVTWS